MTIRENYEQWLKDFADDQDTIRELKAIGEDEKEMEDRFYTELSFGTAGMRGVLGAGLGSFFSSSKIGFCSGVKVNCGAPNGELF